MNVDTLLLTIVQPDDADAAISALTRAGFAVTVIASVGGFLGAHNVTLLIGLPASEIERARAVLQTTCHRRAIHAPLETTISGATLFVCPVTRYVHFDAKRARVDSARAPIEPGTLQLVLAIIASKLSDKLIETLTDWSYHVTVFGTTGGYSHQANTTLLIAGRAERVDSIVEQVRRVCEMNEQPRATIFVLNLTRLEHLSG
jgi:uncharacterized protein YaaQ